MGYRAAVAIDSAAVVAVALYRGSVGRPIHA